MDRYSIFHKPVISLAPMESITDCVVRDLWTQIGGFSFCVSEFLRVTHQLVPLHVLEGHYPELLHPEHQRRGYTVSGTPVFLQLLGSDPIAMAENAAQAVELGVYGIDINFGCPAKTVNRHDGGAVLLKNPKRVFDVLTAVRRAVPREFPVTAKVRLGFEHKEFVEEIACAAETGGACALTVHARTKMEGYQPPAHWSYISLMRKKIRIPILANGEIWSGADYLRCREESSCISVALGRGAIASPGLAMEIRGLQSCMQAHLKPGGADESGMDWQEIESKVLPKFILATEAVYGPRYTVGKVKQWLRFLSRNYVQAEKLWEGVRILPSLDEIKRKVERKVKERCGPVGRLH